jgi:hypothetical protein
MAQSFNRLHTRLSPEHAFDFISDFRHASLWDPNTKSVSLLTGLPIALGSRFSLHARMLGVSFELPYEIVRYERPSCVAFVGETRILSYREQVSFQGDAARGTTIEYRASLTLLGLFALAEPLLALIYQRIGDSATSGILAALDRSQDEAQRTYT